MIDAEPPDCAIVDINLGVGPSFDLTAQLHACAVPFLFLAGHDAIVIPSEYANIQCLQKPVDMLHLVQSVARLRGFSAI